MPPNQESTQVMNPLLGSSLSNHTSIHCTGSGEPKTKKPRLSGSFHSEEMTSPRKSSPNLLSNDGASKVDESEAADDTNASGKDKTSDRNTSLKGRGQVSEIQNQEQLLVSPQESCGLFGKPTKFIHIKNKYHGELTYMLREFEKLERQLLGARKTEESAGSRERREKLHSFIIHLRETVQQIETGVQQEVSVDPGSAEEACAKEEDTVAKLEEHILANLLPVKARLKKQLAAQQGAKHNPIGMPHAGWSQRTDGVAAGTFAAAAAERRRKEAQVQESYVEPKEPALPVEPHQTQYGKPIEKGGSSLTKKLHGQTLGCKNSPTNEPTSPKQEKEVKRYYGGMALGSDQIESSVTAASSVHKLIIRETEVIMKSNKDAQQKQENDCAVSPKKPLSPDEDAPKKPLSPDEDAQVSLMADIVPDGKSPGTGELERRRLRRRKRRRKRQSKELEVSGQHDENDSEPQKSKKGRMGKKQRGPRQVEYMCALCNEVYSSTCDYNPWWALAQHECPKCHKTQIPRVDISAPANSIEYHPALLAHADENCGSVNQPPQISIEIDSVVSDSKQDTVDDDDRSLGSDGSSGIDELSTEDELSLDVDSECDDSLAMTPADRAENEYFGANYAGPRLEENASARLLILMAHASTCPCQHRNLKQQEVCRSTRWMMMHVRDCPGTTSTLDICPFPWCRKVKHLLYHLVSCSDGEQCKICSNPEVGSNSVRLKGLNDYRLKEFRQGLIRQREGWAWAGLVPGNPISPAATGMTEGKGGQACLAPDNLVPLKVPAVTEAIPPVEQEGVFPVMATKSPAAAVASLGKHGPISSQEEHCLASPSKAYGHGTAETPNSGHAVALAALERGSESCPDGTAGTAAGYGFVSDVSVILAVNKTTVAVDQSSSELKGSFVNEISNHVSSTNPIATHAVSGSSQLKDSEQLKVVVGASCGCGERENGAAEAGAHSPRTLSRGQQLTNRSSCEALAGTTSVASLPMQPMQSDDGTFCPSLKANLLVDASIAAGPVIVEAVSQATSPCIDVTSCNQVSCNNATGEPCKRGETYFSLKPEDEGLSSTSDVLGTLGLELQKSFVQDKKLPPRDSEATKTLEPLVHKQQVCPAPVKVEMGENFQAACLHGCDGGSGWVKDFREPLACAHCEAKDLPGTRAAGEIQGGLVSVNIKTEHSALPDIIKHEEVAGPSHVDS